MRNFGLVLMLAGALAFFFATEQVAVVGPVPQAESLSETLAHPAGRWEMLRYAAATAAGVGLLLALFPKGR